MNELKLSALEIANILRDAAEIHEKSWSRKANRPLIQEFEAVEIAMSKQGYKDAHLFFSNLLHMLLESQWNDTLAWAEMVISNSDPDPS